MTPIQATWSSFLEVKIQDLKASLELKILYILYDILYVDAKVLSGERTSLLLPIFIIQMKMEVLRLL